MDLDMVRIRLYVETAKEDPGLFHGKNRTRVCDNIWTQTIYSWSTRGEDTENHNKIWKQLYTHDVAGAAAPWYALDINKFVVLT